MWVGATVHQSASVIHSDLMSGFIGAGVHFFNDFVAHGGEHGAKESDKLRPEDKNYTVRDNDIMGFLSNV